MFVRRSFRPKEQESDGDQEALTYLQALKHEVETSCHVAPNPAQDL